MSLPTLLLSRGVRVPTSDLSRPALATAAPAYVGLVTRAVAFVIDAALILLVELIIGVSGVVIITVLRLPNEINAILAVLGGVIYIVWSISYFVGFWCATGQTPGARVMQFRVLTAEGNVLGPRRALIRCIGLLLAALPLFAGYVLILFDRSASRVPGPAGGDGGGPDLPAVDRRGPAGADRAPESASGGPRARGLRPPRWCRHCVFDACARLPPPVPLAILYW